MLRRLGPTEHPDLLVGAGTGDDAAVWRLSADRALVLTADFITPVVDDPGTWGRVAAANAVSDIYAMGGRPLIALNLVAWNRDELSTDLLGDVLAGAAEIALEAGFLIVGGHTIDDPEPKYGLAVVGEVHPERVLTNTGLRDADALVLTKPLGVGAVTTAIKRGEASPEVVQAAVASMARLNDDGRDAALEAGATGATDITGFGLLGHLARMAEESGVDAAIDVAAVPVLPGARRLAEGGAVAGGSRRNLDWVRDRLAGTEGIAEIDVSLLADAQTSGGLLFGAETTAAAAAVERLRASGHDAAVVGEVRSGTGRIILR